MTYLQNRAGNKHINVLLVTVIALMLIASLTYRVFNKPLPVDEAARQAGEQLALKGRDDVFPCTACHGARGEGNFKAGYPRLAGLHPGYIAKQLQDFARDPMEVGVTMDPIPRDYSKTPRIYSDLTVFTPGTRFDPVMNSVAWELTETEMKNLGIYFGNLPFTVDPQAIDFQTLERGADLALRGKPEYGMPACISCHGPEGGGFGPHFPPLVGQPPEYLIGQIDKWQTGARDNDHLGLMQNIANQMTDGDKLNATAYFSNRSSEKIK
uniref:Cytochrome c553 n=1 Tax=Candidatus Kentrum sp. FW TaxID=2126338 RepID=A0A450SS82_9GAMM|nr:MAG: Cytochrome c553 [Candidatus Kentron sp. FW]